MAHISYQKNVITLSGVGAQDYALTTSVDRTKCWMIVHFTGDWFSLDAGQCWAQINAAGTHITVGRDSDFGAYPMVCSYQIVENSSFSTQWRAVVHTGVAETTSAISAVSARAMIQQTGFDCGGAAPRNRFTSPLIKFNSTTELSVSTEEAAGHTETIYCHVVDFGADIVSSVAYYEISASGVSTNTTISAVDVGKSIVVLTGVKVGTYGQFQSAEQSTFGLTSSTNLNCNNYTSPGYALYGVQVVQFVNMPVVSAQLTTSVVSPTITLAATPIYGGLIIQGPLGGASADNADASYRDERFSPALVGDTWTLTRNTAAAEAKFYYSTFDFNDLTAGGGGSVVVQAMQSLRAQGLI